MKKPTIKKLLWRRSKIEEMGNDLEGMLEAPLKEMAQPHPDWGKIMMKGKISAQTRHMMMLWLISPMVMKTGELHETMTKQMLKGTPRKWVPACKILGNPFSRR